LVFWHESVQTLTYWGVSDGAPAISTA
jgi:hypothetical protein